MLVLLLISLIIASVDIAMSVAVNDWFRLFCDCVLFVLIYIEIGLEFPRWFNGKNEIYLRKREW